MDRFFATIHDIHQFTRALRWNQSSLDCQHCHKHDQWISHGFCYKQIFIDVRQIVGKRIVCSIRYGRSGCGRTHRLYCADRVPCLQYSLTHCIAFLLALVTDQCRCVCTAYRLATGARDSRNTWRWLNRLHIALPNFRIFVLGIDTSLATCTTRSQDPLRKTFEQLLGRFHNLTGYTFQLRTQRAFL